MNLNSGRKPNANVKINEESVSNRRRSDHGSAKGLKFKEIGHDVGEEVQRDGSGDMEVLVYSSSDEDDGIDNCSSKLEQCKNKKGLVEYDNDKRFVMNRGAGSSKGRSSTSQRPSSGEAKVHHGKFHTDSVKGTSSQETYQEKERIRSSSDARDSYLADEPREKLKERKNIRLGTDGSYSRASKERQGQTPDRINAAPHATGCSRYDGHSSIRPSDDKGLRESKGSLQRAHVEKKASVGKPDSDHGNSSLKVVGKTNDGSTKAGKVRTKHREEATAPDRTDSITNETKAYSGSLQKQYPPSRNCHIPQPSTPCRKETGIATPIMKPTTVGRRDSSTPIKTKKGVSVEQSKDKYLKKMKNS